MTEGREERAKETPNITINDSDDAIGGVGGGGSGERATGTPNTIYNLSSVLFHALQGGASYDRYVEDAEREGDEELTEFFRRVREEDRDRAAEARLLLVERTLTDVRAEGTAPSVPVTEDLPPIVTTTEGAEPDVPPRTGPSGGLPGTKPRAEGASSGASGDARREYTVTEMPGEDLTPPEDAVPADAVPADAPGPPEAPPRAEAGQSSRAEPVGPLSGEGEVQPTRTEEVASPRPEPTDEFPGTEPVEGEDSTVRSGTVPPPPEEVPPERAGEIPMAEEVPPPRAEEIPTGTQTQASPGDATSLMPGGIPHEGVVPPPPPPPKGTEESPTAEEERAGQHEEDKGLVERVIDKLTGEEEQRREGVDRPGRR
jgi:hypothetical protein